MTDLPPTTHLVALTVEGAQATLTLSRPDKFNALNVAMINELIELLEWTADRSAGRKDALHDAKGNPYFRTLVLAGEGRHFCAGADINMMRDAGANTPEENRADSERLDRLFHGLGRILASPLEPCKAWPLAEGPVWWLAAITWWPHPMFALHCPKENWASSLQ